MLIEGTVKLDWMTFVFLFSTIGGVWSEMVISKYLIYNNKSPVVPSVIASTEVVSLTECASLCTANPHCKSFSVDCVNLILTKQICNQLSTEITNLTELVNSELCYVQRESLSVFIQATSTDPTTTLTPTTTLAPPPPTTTVTPTTTSNVQSTTAVIDIVYGARDMCPGGNTNEDFLVLKPEGVYVYDEMADLTVGACSGPIQFTTIFKDYPTIPSINSVSGVLIFQTSNIELYAEDIVYKWQIESGNLNNVLGMNTYSAHLGTTALDNDAFLWAAHRTFTSAERHFYLGADTFFMKSSQHGTHQFVKLEVVPDMNANNMNPWSDIPTDTIAVTGYGSDPNKNYALIDSAGNVYTYQLDHSLDNKNPTKSLTLQGQMKN